MASPRFILSPCGTSVLTHGVSVEERNLLNRFANAQSPTDVPLEERHRLEGLLDQAGERLAGADIEQAASQSAELNSLIKLDGGRLAAGPDLHLLLCTDTWLGESTARLIEEWLRARSLSVEIRRQKDLQTARLDTFQFALSELVKWCAEDVANYRSAGYRVIFNLTGGFKSIQGFLQVLATFHADETVYIFEKSADLLRIPHLPVEMAAESSIRQHLLQFRRLSQDLPIDNAAGIPEILLMQMDGQIDLSPWGELVWSQNRKKLYAEALQPSPSGKVCFSAGFGRSLKDLPSERLTLINERIDQLARNLEGDGTYNPPSLDFKPLQGKKRPPSTHEADAWSDRDAKRLFGHFEGGVFILDALAPGLH